MRHHNTRRKNKARRSRKHRGGNGTASRLSTRQELKLLMKPLDRINEMLDANIVKLHENKVECKANCQHQACDIDDETCNQIKSMMRKKVPYEWSTFCKNSLRVTECEGYLQNTKILELYVNYIDKLHKKSELIKEMLTESRRKKTSTNKST